MKMPSRTVVAEGVVVVALLAGTAWLGQLVNHNYVVHPRAIASSGVAVAPMSVPAELATGAESPLAIRAVELPQILLVMSTDCPFCEQNMPQWKWLVDDLAALDDGHAVPVVLSVSDGAATTAYLAAHGVEAEVRIVDRAVLPLLGVSGYPATVAVDPETGAISSWTGVLGESEHTAIMAWAQPRRAHAAP